MEKEFDIQEYMTRGVERIVADAMKATLRNPRESAYMIKFASAAKAASKKRATAEKEGVHIPPFLIASITSNCNLHCAGCYSRCNHSTTDEAPVAQLSDEDWSRIFDEADDLGVSFILLAGGEPLLRKGVIDAAGRGFFHINSHGGAEPCPFSPYSDINVKDTSLKEAINSKLFRSLIERGLLYDVNKGGCVLFEKRDKVLEIQDRDKKKPIDSRL